MFGLLAYYLCLKKKWLFVALCLGASAAIHPTAIFFILPLFIKYRELRNWKLIGIMTSFLLFYLYIPITNRPPYMWDQPNSNGIFGFIKDTLQTAQMLSGTLGIWDLPKRILDLGGILLLSLGIGIFTIIWLFIKTKWYKNVALWIVILSVVYCVTDLSIQTYVYLLPAIAFGSVIIGIELSKFRKEWLYTCGIIAVVMLGVNANYFDIGRTLDPNLSATEYFNTELSKVGDGEILLAQHGWEWAAIYKYNKDNGKDIIPVAADTLQSPVYQDNLRQTGIKLVKQDYSSIPYAFQIKYIMQDIIKDNPDKVIWTTKTTDASTYGAEVVLAYKDGVSYNQDLFVPNLGLLSGIGKWHFKPSNPYDIITGSIEIKDWSIVTMSNYNVLTFGMLILIGYIPIWIIWQIVFNKKKWNLNKSRKVV
jgi:hypothetical protein